MTEPYRRVDPAPMTHHDRDSQFGRRYQRDMTPEDCEAHGGHCWVLDPMVKMSSPPIYTEWCKHCAAYREGRPQPDVAWGEPKFRP